MAVSGYLPEGGFQREGEVISPGRERRVIEDPPDSRTEHDDGLASHTTVDIVRSIT